MQLFLLNVRLLTQKAKINIFYKKISSLRWSFRTHSFWKKNQIRFFSFLGKKGIISRIFCSFLKDFLEHCAFFGPVKIEHCRVISWSSTGPCTSICSNAFIHPSRNLQFQNIPRKKWYIQFPIFEIWNLISRKNRPTWHIDMISSKKVVLAPVEKAFFLTSWPSMHEWTTLWYISGFLSLVQSCFIRSVSIEGKKSFREIGILIKSSVFHDFSKKSRQIQKYVIKF